MNIKARLARLESAARPRRGVGLHVLPPPHTRHDPRYRDYRDRAARRLRADRAAGKKIIALIVYMPEG